MDNKILTTTHQLELYTLRLIKVHLKFNDLCCEINNQRLEKIPSAFISIESFIEHVNSRKDQELRLKNNIELKMKAKLLAQKLRRWIILSIPLNTIILAEGFILMSHKVESKREIELICVDTYTLEVFDFRNID